MKELELNSTHEERNISSDVHSDISNAEPKREFVAPKLVKHGGLNELTGMPPTVFSP